ncbi:MAG TPA: hypothetical protein VFK76_11885 [Gaiellaceae bacterium]|nr:hypothetical protein [Gaiellaceae bacterium]
MCAFAFGGTNKAEQTISKASSDTASEVLHGVGFEGRYEDLEGGYTVGFETFADDVDFTPRLKGLPTDSCRAPHWGYVVEGRLTYRIGEHEAEIEGGEGFYVPAGHTLFAEAGSEVIFFSPTREWKQTVAKIAKEPEAVLA